MDAVPLCLRTKDVDEIVHTVALLAGSFGGVNLEDISAPRCFEIERRPEGSLRYSDFSMTTSMARLSSSWRRC